MSGANLAEALLRHQLVEITIYAKRTTVMRTNDNGLCEPRTQVHWELAGSCYLTRDALAISDRRSSPGRYYYLDEFKEHFFVLSL
jgi:hypothetical protein